jgi:hypothetical protein
MIGGAQESLRNSCAARGFPRRMRHLLAIPVVVLAMAGGASAADTAQPPPLAAKLTTCTTGPTPPDRAAVFTGSMPRLAGAAQMAMRFDLLERRPGSPFFRRVAAPKLGVWDRSRRDPTLPGYIVTKRVEGLAAPGVYRAIVRFRWYDAAGNVLRHVRRVTRACRQFDPRPDLTIGRVSVVGGAEAGQARYVVEVVNLGRGDAAVPFAVDLTVDGAPQPTQMLAALGGHARATVSFVAPMCTDGSALRIGVDGGKAIDETNEANNVAVRPCRPATPGAS